MGQLVRSMTLTDVDDCLRIERETYPLPWTEGIFLDELAAPGRVYLVIEDEGAMCSSVMGE